MLRLSEQMTIGTPSVTPRINAWLLARITSPLVRRRRSLRQTTAAMCLPGALPHVQSPLGELQQERAFFKDHWHTHKSNQGIKHSFKQPSAYQFKLFWEGEQDLHSLRHWLPCGSAGLQQLVPTIQVSERSFSLCTQHQTQSQDGCNPDEPEDSYLVGPSYEPQGVFVAPRSGGVLDGHPPISERFSLLPKTTRSSLTRGSLLRGRAIILTISRYVCLCVYYHISLLTYFLTLAIQGMFVDPPLGGTTIRSPLFSRSS